MSTKENKEIINTAIQPEGIPMPLVKLNRWILLIGVLIGLFLQQPLLTTVLFLLLLPTVIFGQRWSLIGIVGKMLFAKRIPTAEYEDRRLMRFNNTIASVLLGSAQPAFVLGFPIVGWTLSLMVAAAGVALAGFCVDCFLYFQFKMLRYLNNIHIQ